jgi:Helix-turn-helix domain
VQTSALHSTPSNGPADHRTANHGEEHMNGATTAHDATRLPALLTIPRAAEILGFSRASAYRYAASGELPTKRFGGRVYVITAQIRHLFVEGLEAA